MDLATQLRMALDPAALFASATGHAPDNWQAGVLRSDAVRLLLCCCRQAGKSTVVAALALHTALYTSDALVLLLSPSLRQSSELFKKVAAFYDALDRPVETTQETALQLRLANGARIVSLPGQDATVRGFSGCTLAIIDEAARVPDDLYIAVRPMLSVSGGRLVCLSTPYGRRGFFWKEWTDSAAPWQRFRVPASQCPRISAAFLEEERRSLPARAFQSEYGCEFTEIEDNVFSQADVAAALSDEVHPLWK